MQKLLIEYDRQRDNYLPACELSKTLSILMKKKRLTDRDLHLLYFIGYEYKVTDYDLPKDYFDDAIRVFECPTLKIEPSGASFVGRFRDKHYRLEEKEFNGIDIDSIFIAMMEYKANNKTTGANE